MGKRLSRQQFQLLALLHACFQQSCVATMAMGAQRWLSERTRTDGAAGVARAPGAQRGAVNLPNGAAGHRLLLKLIEQLADRQPCSQQTC